MTLSRSWLVERHLQFLDNPDEKRANTGSLPPPINESYLLCHDKSPPDPVFLSFLFVRFKYPVPLSEVSVLYLSPSLPLCVCLSLQYFTFFFGPVSYAFNDSAPPSSNQWWQRRPSRLFGYQSLRTHIAGIIHVARCFSLLLLPFFSFFLSVREQQSVPFPSLGVCVLACWQVGNISGIQQTSSQQPHLVRWRFRNICMCKRFHATKTC